MTIPLVIGYAAVHRIRAAAGIQQAIKAVTEQQARDAAMVTQAHGQYCANGRHCHLTEALAAHQRSLDTLHHLHAMTARDVIPALTDEQVAALTATAIGLTQPVIARRLGTPPRTLRRLLRGAVTRLGAADLTHAVALAAQSGLIDPDHVRCRTLPAPIPGDRQDREATRA